MDRPLTTRQGVDAVYEIPGNMSRLGAAVKGSNPTVGRSLSPAARLSSRGTEKSLLSSRTKELAPSTSKAALLVITEATITV
jgi:hypothetical protein